MEKISGWNNKKSSKRDKVGERERERVLMSFVVGNLKGIEDRAGNEIIRNLYKN